jgi:anti-sigma B factor antagonist
LRAEPDGYSGSVTSWWDYNPDRDPGHSTTLNLTPRLVPLEISIRESSDVTILDLRGRATISDGESDLLRARLDQLIANGARKLLLNLVELTHVDSSGFSVIVKVCVSARDKGGDLRFIRPRGPALVAFNVLRLLDLIRTFDSEAEALASFRASGSPAQP